MPSPTAPLTAVGITQTTTLFAMLVPDIITIRNSTPTTGLVTDVRTAETVATLVALGTGIGLSFAAGNAGPLTASALTAVTLVALIECLLRSAPPLSHSSPTTEGNNHV